MDPETQRIRADHDRVVEQLAEGFARGIAAHLLTYRKALSVLMVSHQTIADDRDVDLNAESREAAIWEVSGRCIALARSWLDQVELGYGPETVGTARVLHEAADLFLAVSFGPSGVVSDWLRGERISQKRVDRVVRSYWAKEEADLLAAGVDLAAFPQVQPIVDAAAQLGASHPVSIGDIPALTSRRAWGLLSQGAHNRRGNVGEGIQRKLRRFEYGPHRDPRLCAQYVEAAGAYVQRILLEIGSAFATFFFSGEYFMSAIFPAFIAIGQVIEETPIGEEAIQAAEQEVRRRLGMK